MIEMQEEECSYSDFTDYFLCVIQNLNGPECKDKLLIPKGYAITLEEVG